MSSHVAKLDEETCRVWRSNHELRRRGAVTCAATRRATTHSALAGFLNVGVSKQLGELGAALSPFNVFPAAEFQAFATEDGSLLAPPLPRRSLELVWQSAKVKPTEIASNGLVGDAFFLRRKRIYEAGVVKRRYYDHKREGVEGSVFEWAPARPRGWVESRAFYAAAYKSAVAASAAFEFVKVLHEDGLNLQLMGPDGAPMTASATSPTPAEISAAYESTLRPFGHEHVLVALLLDIAPWTGRERIWSLPRITDAAAASPRRRSRSPRRWRRLVPVHAGPGVPLDLDSSDADE